jgi:hypothetical protein
MYSKRLSANTANPRKKRSNWPRNHRQRLLEDNLHIRRLATGPLLTAAHGKHFGSLPKTMPDGMITIVTKFHFLSVAANLMAKCECFFLSAVRILSTARVFVFFATLPHIIFWYILISNPCVRLLMEL